VFEYLSGNSLAKLIDSVGSIPEFILSKVIKEVAKGVGFIHSSIGAHGGLTESQVYFTREGYVKVGMGLLKRVANNSPSVANDVFDIGYMTLLAALGGNEWFEQEQIDNVQMNCCMYHSLEEVEPNPLFDRFSPNLKNFLCSSLQFDERRRISMEDILTHPWIIEKQMIGPKVRVTELLGISYKWFTTSEVNYQAEKQLDRICESLFMILDSGKPPMYS
jgi:serine/threonine protein kinase